MLIPYYIQVSALSEKHSQHYNLEEVAIAEANV